jgi:adenylate cyclase
VRVRIAGDRAFLTLKGARTGYSRHEFEYEVPLPDAQEMLANLCHGALIEKTRYPVLDRGREWVVDVFEGGNTGLVIAEIELKSENEEIDLPEWVGLEVTPDPRYLNINLVAQPFSLWSAAERAAGDRTNAADP